jgi:hypothetical protein
MLADGQAGQASRLSTTFLLPVVTPEELPGGGSGGGPVFRIALTPAAPSPLPIPYPVWS